MFCAQHPGIDIIDFRSVVADAVGTPVMLENDVNLAVLGEQWLGRGQGIDDLAFIALGTGIGAGLIVNGALVRGAAGTAGELGYLPFGVDPFEAESPRVGAFERVTATHGIRAAYHASTGTLLDVPAIFAAAACGDGAAQHVPDGVARQAGAGGGDALRGGFAAGGYSGTQSVRAPKSSPQRGSNWRAASPSRCAWNLAPWAIMRP